MAPVDKAALLGATLPQGTVETELGDFVVRGLSRAEVVRLQALPDRDSLENETLALGMVEPSLTVEEAASWRAVADNDLVRTVSDAILEISGLTEGGQTAKERRFRPGRG